MSWEEAIVSKGRALPKAGSPLALPEGWHGMGEQGTAGDSGDRCLGWGEPPGAQQAEGCSGQWQLPKGPALHGQGQS